jgi:hypothetical protein
MKTQILRLESHDDFISARDKMGWSKAERILLVWPEGSHTLYRRLDLILLLRHSSSLGAQLALVCDDTDVRYHANQLGIPVYNTIQNAQISHWRTRRRRTSQRIYHSSSDSSRPDLTTLAQDAHPQPSSFISQPIIRLGLFTLGVLALLSIAAILIPRVEITLMPETRVQELTLLVKARPGTEDVNVSGTIPARKMTVEVEGRLSTLTSGKTTIPQEYAKGQIRFTNLTDQSITIPAQTVVRNLDIPAIRYATSATAQLPAGVGEAITVTVQALEPGKPGNQTANQLVAIEGELGASMSATNPKPTTGGTESQISTATDNDREELLAQLAAELRQTVQEELIRQLSAGDILFTPTITIAQIVEQVYDPPENLPSDEISLNLRVEYQALVAAHADLEQIAQYALDANLPDMYLALPDTIVIRNITSPILKGDGTAKWRIQATQRLRARIPESDAVSLSLGMAPLLAMEKLASELPVSSQPSIQLTPSWWPRLPILPFQYTITIQQ